MTLADLLFSPEQGASPDEVVIHAGARRVTRAELTSQATAVRDALQRVGVPAGAPVAVMLPTSPDTVAAMFGVWAAGAVYMPLNPRLADDEVGRLLDTVDCAAVIATAEDAARFGDAAPVLDPTGSLLRGPERAPGVPTHDPDVALVQMTSGTTGSAKAVLLLHSAVLALMDNVLRSVRGESKATKRSATANLIPVSLSLWAGIYNVCFAFRVGAPVVLMERFEPAEFARLVAEHDVKSVVLPPAAMTMLSDDEAVTSLAPLQWVRSITAPLSPFQARRFHDRFGVGILNSYGQTELGGEVVGWNARDWREWGESKLGAAGRPHAGVEVRVADDGELLIRAPAQRGGYAATAGAMEDRESDGWLHTGDVGSVDDDGFVWIEGRVSDQINRGGMKIVPTEVEEVLRAAPGVSDAAVVGAPDDRLGEVPVAFVVTEGAVDADALAAHCRDHVAPWKVPVRFVEVDALPRNEVGKLLRRELVARLPGTTG